MNSINWGHELWLSAPLLLTCFGALVLLMLEVFLKNFWFRELFTGGVLIASAILAQMAIPLLEGKGTAFFGLLYIDPFSSFISILLLLGALLAVLISANRLTRLGIKNPGEYYCLLLFATAGGMLFIAAAELITLFVGLEIMSMALYCLCGSALLSKRSSESALKYFLLGSFSSAFLLYGIALLYGLTGTTSIDMLSVQLATVRSPVVYFGLGLVLVGLVFKIGAVPFHFWAPDVYEGAPTSVTAYMACVIKAAAFAASLRVLWVGFDGIMPFWIGAVWLMAVLTMTVGNIIAIRQRNVKRMLAYSSIAHAGYLMVAFLVPQAEFGGGPALLYYLISYTLMTMGAFAVLLIISSEASEKGISEKESTEISYLNGLGYSRPVLAALMTLFMLSLAGIPPGFAGFLGKFYIFGAAIKADYLGIVIIAVLNSAASCYYYLRVIVAMYFVESESSVVHEKAPDFGLPMASALGVCALGVIFFGLFPSSVYDTAQAVMLSFR